MQSPSVSSKNNYPLASHSSYLVSKWAEAIPLRDQTAANITDALVKVCYYTCTWIIPVIIHSDQLKVCYSEAFGIKKTRTHQPQGDGMVVRLYRSLLQLLRTYVEREEDWYSISSSCLGHCLHMSINRFQH